jgi:glycosyltransferase involved in cell wall biosynthesis
MNNKVFILRPAEDWIVDRLVDEWYENNSDISVKNPEDADVIWLLASWCYRNIDRKLLSQKKVITTVHHVVNEKFNQQKFLEFQERDSITDVYHVPNQHTEKFIKSITKKPISIIPYWANQKIWKSTVGKFELRKKYNIPKEGYVIGSFQRDTEGSDLRTPKLEKGPDLLADSIEKLWQTNKKIFVVLAGWRRQYIISRLTRANIPFVYVEKPSQSVINELYQTLDLYPVTARYEGGPQALIECGLLNIPVISRNVGIASVVLPNEAINDDVTVATPIIPNVENLKLPSGQALYRKLIESL